MESLGGEPGAAPDDALLYAGSAPSAKSGDYAGIKRFTGGDRRALHEGPLYRAASEEGNGIPLVKLKSGDIFQPIFTDVIELQRFNREKKFRPVVVDALKLAQVHSGGGKGHRSQSAGR